MKDIITFLLDLDINIYVLINNTATKRLFNCVIKAIKYYQPIRSSKHAKFIIFQLVKLSLLIESLINLNYTKYENRSNHYNISNKMENKIL